MKRYMEFARANTAGSGRERVALLLDHSASMGSSDWTPTRWEGAVKAARALIEVKATQDPDDELGVVVFSSDARTLHAAASVSKSARALKRSLSSVGPESSTNIAAGLRHAKSLLFQSGTGREPYSELLDPGKWIAKLLGAPDSTVSAAEESVIRRVILLTDGEYNVGRAPERLARELKSAGVFIDCIGIGGSPSEVDEKCLKAMASQNSDGSPRYCFIGDHRALIREFEQLANRIRPV